MAYSKKEKEIQEGDICKHCGKGEILVFYDYETGYSSLVCDYYHCNWIYD